MKDLLVLFPTLGVGLFVLFQISEDTYRRGSYTPTYLVFLAFLFGVLLFWYRTKLLAAERQRAAARPFDPGYEPVSPTRAVVAVGVGTPVGVCLTAWLASLTVRGEPAVPWVVAGLVSVTALVCGTYLLTRLPGSAFGTSGRPPWNGRSEGLKPQVHDPDAYDHVGTRG